MTRRAHRMIFMILMAASLIGAADTGASVAAAPGPSVRTAEVTIDVNGGFETGDFTGWQVDGAIADVAVIASDPPPACFQPDMPSEGSYMACLSTGTFFGGSANGDVRSDLTSDPITFPFRPHRLTVSFTVDFQTDEEPPSIVFNDAFQARLVTLAGTFVMLQIDTFGRTTPGRGLRVVGFEGYDASPPGCPLDKGHRTGKMTVTWTKNLDPITRHDIGSGPVYIEFSIADQGGPGRTSIACVDEVRLTAGK